MTDTAERTSADAVADVTGWLEEHWDPEITVAEWWERLGTSGWAAPSWPLDWYGKGLAREDAVRVQRTIADFGALGAPGGLGLLLAGPTIITHGDDEQRRRYLRDIVTGQKAWCQLFSEPGAGSDLAGLQTRAVRDGDEWVVNGQKVWTSNGQVADLGMLIARTDPDVPKHQGITFFALDMHQPGVDVRPLREITGRAMFNEVFLTDARVEADALIGGAGQGWAVANTTLAFERAGLGAGGGSESGGRALPGSVAGDLELRVGDFVGGGPGGGHGGNRRPGGVPSGGVLSMLGATGALLGDLARKHRRLGDATIRQDLARLYSYGEVGRFMSLRQKALREVGSEIPGAGNMAKLSMSRIVRLTRELGLSIVGAYGMLHAYSAADREALDEVTGEPELGLVTEIALFSPAPAIYGGTDEIQRNILGERVLGLPKEPNNDRTMPFRDLPKNG